LLKNFFFENEVIKKKIYTNAESYVLKKVQRAKIMSVIQYITMSQTDFTLLIRMTMGRKCATCEAGTDIL